MIPIAGLVADQSGAQANGATSAGSLNHDSGPVTPPDASGVAVACGMRSSGTYTEDPDFTQVTTGSVNYYAGYLLNPSGSTELEYTSDDTESTANQINALAGASGGGTVVNPLGGGGGSAARPITFNRHEEAANDDEFLLRANR